MVFSTGLVEPLMLVATMALLPVVSPHWRTIRWGCQKCIGISAIEASTTAST